MNPLAPPGVIFVVSLFNQNHHVSLTLSKFCECLHRAILVATCSIALQEQIL